MSETEVSKAIQDYLTLNGWYVLRIQSGSVLVKKGGYCNLMKLAPKGTPDIMALKEGKCCFFEVKKDQKTKEQWERKIENFKKTARMFPSYHKEIAQFKTLERIKQAGGYSFLVCSVKDAENAIKSIFNDNAD